jgi:hypothetical protein
MPYNTTIIGNQEIDALIGVLQSHGLIIPNWIIIILIFIVIIAKMLGYFDNIYSVLIRLRSSFIPKYDYDQKQFIGLRNNFIKHLVYEVERLNREADWADFNYTELEAEVEVDPIVDWNMTISSRLLFIPQSFYHAAKALMGWYPASKVEKSLINAIMKSKSHAFLIIGDPGSGKTVSLKHLFLRMSDTCIKSKKFSAVLPIYMNLNDLVVEPNEVCAKKIDEWILDKLRAGQDRTIHEFLNNNLSKMLEEGSIFFLFDSFDEIPAVIDAQEEQEVVHQYAKALDDFLHSQHQCRGLVSSRPYRAPKTFIGQRMTIRPLSDKRIKEALYRYMGQELLLAKKLWEELYRSRIDILQIARNPFYLALLAGFVKDKKILPERHFDLFEHFVQNRALIDENRLQYFGLSPSGLIQQASILAFSMTQANNIGLSARMDQLKEITSNYNKEDGWDQANIGSLLDALCYSKLGRILQEEMDKPKVFSFVHRRFHEYFCARYIKQQFANAPIDRFARDDRWREVLVLLCEVLPAENLIQILELIRSALRIGEKSKSGSFEHKKAIETLRFLKDGFRSRINDIPQDIRMLCSNFIQMQFQEGNPLDQKRATEAISIADDESIHSILELALASPSPRVRETAIRSCNILRFVPVQIATEIRRYLYQRYSSLQTLRDYAAYSVLFSSPPSLKPFGTYLKILLLITLAQYLGLIIFYTSFFLYDPSFVIYSIFITLLWFMFVPYLSLVKDTRKDIKIPIPRQLISNPWILLWIIVIYTVLAAFMSKSFILNSSISNLLIFLPMTDEKRSYIFNSLLIASFFIALNILIIDTINNFTPSVQILISYPIRMIKSIGRLIKVVNKETAKEIVLAIGIIAGVIGLIFLGFYLIARAFEIIKDQGFSIFHIYSTHGLIITLLIVFAALIAVLILLTIIMASIIIFYKIVLSLFKLLLDQIKFRSISLKSDNRPKTTTEAIQFLHSFKLDWCKAQYAHSLLKWMPSGEDPQLLIEEANKIRASGAHNVEVSDALYALAEVWEDSMPK